MKPWMWLGLLALLLLGVAFAQALPPGVDPGKPSTWFLTAAGWGGLVTLFINFAKANFWRELSGSMTVLVCAALTVGGSFIAATGVLSPLGIGLEGSFLEVLTFGVTAFVSSTGAWDTYRRAQVVQAAAVKGQLPTAQEVTP